jgi:hypothetical protein
MGDDNVVDITKARGSIEIKRDPSHPERAACQHRAVWIWANEPILECRTCGATVDPHQWIRRHVGNWENVLGELKYTKRDLEREIGELKKAVRILRREYADEAEKREAERSIMVMPPRKSYTQDPPR